MLLYYSEPQQASTQYVLKTVFEILGVKTQHADPAHSQIQLYYGLEKPSDFHGLFIPHTPQSNPLQLLENPQNLTQPTFDIFLLIGYLLQDQYAQKLPDEAYDDLGRLKHEYSLEQALKRPYAILVNELILHFKEWLTAHYKGDYLPLWPEGKTCAVILSHDVDQPEKYGHYRYMGWCPAAKGAKAFFRHYRNWARTTAAYFFASDRHDYWLFEDILQQEKAHGFVSTFFFAVTERNTGWGHFNDVPYPVHAPRYKDIFQRVLNAGGEIGLHASYNAYRSADYFAKEKNKLAGLCEKKILGLRHHYWHMGRDYMQTLKHHETAGFEYDTSLAFNYNSGFRGHIAWPYFPFITQQNQALNVLQIPSFCMDGHLFYTENTQDNAIHEIEKWIDVLTFHQGVGAIDWHVRTSYPRSPEFKVWGETYQSILTLLSRRPDIWVTSFEQVNYWWRQRLKNLGNLKQPLE